MTKEKQQSNPVALVEAGNAVALTLNKMKDEFSRVLSGVDPERFTRIAITTVKKNPKLLEADRQSLISSIMTAAQVNLEVDPNIGHVALVPYWDWRAKQNVVQMQLMYKGLVELIYRSGRVKKIYARCFYENEIRNGNFKVVLGTDDRIEHNPILLGEPGKLAGAYSVAVLNDGTISFDWMTRSQMEKVRDRKKDKDGKTILNAVWETDEEEMFKKTVVKRHSKMLPKSFEIRDERQRKANDELNAALAVDNAVDNGDISSINKDGEIIIDSSTGEVTESSSKNMQDITPPKKQNHEEPEYQKSNQSEDLYPGEDYRNVNFPE